jgi:hypothetical protein
VQRVALYTRQKLKRHPRPGPSMPRRVPSLMASLDHSFDQLQRMPILPAVPFSAASNGTGTASPSTTRGPPPHIPLNGLAAVLSLLRQSNEVTDDPSKLARYLLRDGGCLIFHCARLSHPTTHWHAETCHYPGRGSSNPFYVSLREWSRLPFTARIERAPFHRARSASKKGTWPLPPHPS